MEQSVRDQIAGRIMERSVTARDLAEAVLELEYCAILADDRRLIRAHVVSLLEARALMSTDVRCLYCRHPIDDCRSCGGVPEACFGCFCSECLVVLGGIL
jgi:hypothetical protein